MWLSESSKKGKIQKPCHKFWKEILFIVVPEDVSHNKSDIYFKLLVDIFFEIEVTTSCVYSQVTVDTQTKFGSI